MKKKRVQYEEDDGETIANMNVDGMPWYREDDGNNADPNKPKISLRTPEGRAAIRGAALAGLLFVVIFAGGAFLFILFCEKIWLK